MWPFDLPEADKVYAFRNRETNYVYKFDSARDSWRPTQTGPAIFTSIASRAAVSTWAIREKLKLFTCASWHTPPPRNVTVMVKFQFIPRYYLLINAFVACDATSSAQMFLDYATWSNFFFFFPPTRLIEARLNFSFKTCCFKRFLLSSFFFFIELWTLVDETLVEARWSRKCNELPRRDFFNTRAVKVVL